MRRDRLLWLLRSAYGLTRSEMERVEVFITALDPELTMGQMEGIAMYIAALREERRGEADTA